MVETHENHEQEEPIQIRLIKEAQAARANLASVALELVDRDIRAGIPESSFEQAEEYKAALLRHQLAQAALSEYSVGATN